MQVSYENFLLERVKNIPLYNFGSMMYDSHNKICFFNMKKKMLFLLFST